MIDKKPFEEVLYDNKWLSLKQIVKPEDGIKGYVFSHETRCNGRIVSILPFKRTTNGKEYLIRREITPCWGLQYELSSITGGVEEDDPIHTAIMEMAEEAGYEICVVDLISLGTCFASKSSDTVYNLYAIDLTNMEKTLEAKGDGSELEKKAYCEWVTDLDILQSNDAQLIASYSRLNAVTIIDKVIGETWETNPDGSFSIVRE